MNNQSFDIPFIIDKIILIESLNGIHKSTAEDLYKNILLSQFDDINPIYESIESKDDLINLLIKIDSCITQNKFHPLIHIEAHGLDSELGLSLNSSESITWEELKPYLRRINISCCNNLVLCISACNSINIVKELVTAFYDNDRYESPFFGFVSPIGRVTWEELYMQYSVFYKSLSKEKNFNMAVTEMNKGFTSKFSYYSCYQAFLIIIKKFANTFIKDRVLNIQKDFSVLDECCEMYNYTL
ncbi:MAG: hypothetical protein IPO85_04790 [Saprospiraceae bacterium]|uniref:Uncharacterized protein n=1 Tax=Candidatus Defluviibacterium haderslevense TaxID=2981993 RepID=A0A9D7S8R7_9BACT|nr:hypothetical protein [Candidatus Defluviibacterium haderslevense]